jgi:RNA methyltransferase, TrmH family
MSQDDAERAITSTTNRLIKDIVRLRTRRHRDSTGRFIVEGYRELQRALDGGVAVETLLVCDEFFLGSNEPVLVNRAAEAGTRIVSVGAAAFRKSAYRDRPEGLLAVAKRYPTGLADLDLGQDPLILVAESIEKPGNLGTMLRTAAAASADAVIVADPTTDPFNPNVVRASLGHLFTLPLGVAATADVIEYLRASGVRLVATTPAANLAHHDADLTGGVAIVVGSEQYGLSERWLAEADDRVAIPMPGPADSLNAATAAAIVLFEAVRQRGSST